MFSKLKNQLSNVMLDLYLGFDEEDTESDKEEIKASNNDISENHATGANFTLNDLFDEDISQKAKSIGSYLLSTATQTGKTVQEAGLKMKNVLEEFNKCQDAFIKEKQVKTVASSVPPWVGCPNEEALREECLNLSGNRRNFLRSPPSVIDFQFDYEVSYPVAMSIMQEDARLQKMRFNLVPKHVSEERFWRNYFYRVSLICQAYDKNESQSVNSSEVVEEMNGEFGISEEVSVKSSKTSLDLIVEEMPQNTFEK